MRRSNCIIVRPVKRAFMFNIKRGMVSLDVECVENKVCVYPAKDDLSQLLALGASILVNEQSLANGYIASCRPHDCENGLRWFFQSREYNISRLSTHVRKTG